MREKIFKLIIEATGKLASAQLEFSEAFHLMQSSIYHKSTDESVKLLESLIKTQKASISFLETLRDSNNDE